MASVAAARPRLILLEKAARRAEMAVKTAKQASYALEDRQERRNRRLWYSSEDEDEDEDDDVKEQAARDREDHPDEEADDFDFGAKQERLQNEILQRKTWATEAYRVFVTELEECVKKDTVGPLTALHDRMQAKLPVELRDMIYSFLDIQKSTLCNDPTRRRWVYVRQNQYDPNFHDHPSIEIDEEYIRARMLFGHGSFELIKPGGWLLNPEYVGHGMAREIAERFYSANHFSVHVDRLGEFLTSDRTGTGLKPYEHIQNSLSIHIVTTRCNGSSETAWKSTANETAFLDGLYIQLSYLTLLTPKTKLSVEFGIHTSAQLRTSYEQGERRFYNIMESVRAPIYDLIHAGVSVNVRHVHSSTNHTRNISEEPLNYFRMSKEAWEEEKRSHGTDWKPSTNFITREELDDTDEERRSDAERRLREALERRWGHTSSIDGY